MAAALYLSKLNVNGQEYQIKDANAATGTELQDKADILADGMASKVGYATYDSEKQTIFFYDIQDERNRTELFKIDATDFIKDGMVSNVAISEGNLVITFNTDAGQEPISIALTDIFNPANYYNKTEVDGKLDLKADASNVYTKSEADGKFLTEHQSLADYPTIETMNTALGQKANVSDIYTQTEIDNKLAAKANSADLATVATSGSYNDLSDKPVIPEGAVVDAALSDTSENPVQNKVVKAAIESAKAYYVDFAAMSVQGITDADWDGLVAAINAHRPILVKVSASNGYVNATSSLITDNVIYITGADGNYASTYTFTKNGSNDYSVSTSTKQFVSQAEKDAWNAKADASALTEVRQDVDKKANSADLATVATSGSYNDLSDKPVIPEGTVVDAALSDTSENPVQNKVVKGALNAKANASEVYTKLQADARWPYNTYVSVDGETLVITSSLLR